MGRSLFGDGVSDENQFGTGSEGGVVEVLVGGDGGDGYGRWNFGEGERRGRCLSIHGEAVDREDA